MPPLGGHRVDGLADAVTTGGVVSGIVVFRKTEKALVGGRYTMTTSGLPSRLKSATARFSADVTAAKLLTGPIVPSPLPSTTASEGAPMPIVMSGRPSPLKSAAPMPTGNGPSGASSFGANVPSPFPSSTETDADM